MRSIRNTLVAVLSLLLTGAMLSPTVSGAQVTHKTASGPTAKQKSQMQYLMTYGHEANGKAPTSAQAFAVVKKYPSVPTMAEAAAEGLIPPSGSSTHATTAGPSGPSAQLIGQSSLATVSTPKTGIVWHPTSADKIWQLGAPHAKEIGWNQTLRWKFNANHNVICCQSTSGYPWVAPWISWLWHYSGEYTSDGYPRWQTGGGGAYYKYIEYEFIETFGWGYGPVSGSFNMQMWIAGFANGSSQNGYF